ncbi:MAG: aspartate aminotransferase family protein [Candidatus Thermoplasmatota archaeon]|nr:aspartate aminotransferase family protein [Candidatus Thermoplasmatota archaeon]
MEQNELTDNEQIMEMEKKYHFQIYNRVPVTLVRGKGTMVYDTNGKGYLDMLGGIAVNALGHGHPDVIEAIRRQSEKIIHCTNIYYIEPQVRLAKLLVDGSDLDRVFFCNSGTEAVEGALKLARKWGNMKGKGGKVISMEGSFHGRTLGSLMATGQMKYREDLSPLPDGFAIIPFNDLDSVKGAIDDDTCAILIEPVQGEGGVKVADKEYLEGLRKLCDDNDILLIFDEIQCGMGRIGQLFAYQEYGVVPDVITLAKALGAGFPIGAILAKDDVASAFKPGDHGTTFGGNPLATAVSAEVVSILSEEAFLRNVRENGIYFRSQIREALKGMDVVDHIRGKGLMVGIVLKKNGKEVVNRMFEKGVLSNCTADTVIRLLPPLNVKVDEIDTTVRILVDSIKEVYPDG